MSESSDIRGADADDERLQTVTNDAAAGATVFPGEGDGNRGPTGGSPKEQEPDFAENELRDATIDLGDTE